MTKVLQADPDLPFDVLLTTYELVMADATFLNRMHWRYAIIDEAQRLKNASSVCSFNFHQVNTLQTHLDYWTNCPSHTKIVRIYEFQIA